MFCEYLSPNHVQCSIEFFYPLQDNDDDEEQRETIGGNNRVYSFWGAGKMKWIGPRKLHKNG